MSQLDTEWNRLCGDTDSLTRTISKDSLASNVVSVTPRHQVNGQAPNDPGVENDEELMAVLGTPEPGVGIGEPRLESFFLEPLQPALLRPNKEKVTPVSKHDESGEGRGLRRRGGRSPVDHMLINQTHSDMETVDLGGNGTPSEGFFLHGSSQVRRVDRGSDSEMEDDVDDDDDDVEKQEGEKLFLTHCKRIKCLEQHTDDGESLKLYEDRRVQEHEDKDGTSGRGSPNSLSQSSSARVTSFAERKKHYAAAPDSHSTASSSHATTPEGSDLYDLSPDGKTGTPSDLVHLKLQLEEKRRAIEAQKKKVAVLTARQRIRLGKAAFLNVVKKDRGDTLPHPVKHKALEMKGKESAKDDACFEMLKAKCKESGAKLKKDLPASLDNNHTEMENWDEAGGDLDLSECSHSIELLNDAIGSIQQQMMQLSVQQELLIRQSLKSPQQEFLKKPHEQDTKDPKPQPSMQYVEISTAKRAPPKLSVSRPTPRPKASEFKFSKSPKSVTRTPGADPKLSPEAQNQEEENVSRINSRVQSRLVTRNTMFHVHHFGNQRSDGLDTPESQSLGVEEKENLTELSEEKKAHLIEVDLSELAEGPDPSEQKSGLGFFFKVKFNAMIEDHH